jgi:hypothetical protein
MAPAECGKGTVEKPEAEPGNLCVYTTLLEGVPNEYANTIFITDSGLPRGEQGAGTTGANLRLYAESTPVSAEGTWAVTAK